MTIPNPHAYYSGPQFSAPESTDPPTPAQVANLGAAAAYLARQLMAFVTNLDMPRDPALTIDDPRSPQLAPDVEEETARNIVAAANSLYMIAGASFGVLGTIGTTPAPGPAVNLDVMTGHPAVPRVSDQR